MWPLIDVHYGSWVCQSAGLLIYSQTPQDPLNTFDVFLATLPIAPEITESSSLRIEGVSHQELVLADLKLATHRSLWGQEADLVWVLVDQMTMWVTSLASFLVAVTKHLAKGWEGKKGSIWLRV